MVASKKDAAPEQVLPLVKDGDLAKVVRVGLISRKTTPPAEYTEGTLINDMRGAAKFLTDEKLRGKLRGEIEGIGTAATRGEIIQELLASKLIEKRKGKLHDTEKGRLLIDRLGWSLDEAVQRTALLEAKLSLIAQGTLAKSLFDTEFIAETTAAVKTVASFSPVPKSTPKGGTDTMSDTRRSSPTPKQLAFAQAIATRKGIALPKEALESFDACREFIDQHNTSLPPSEKSMSFAQAIATRKGIGLPDDVKGDQKLLSAWIDANK